MLLSARSHNDQVEISSVTWRDWDTGEETEFAEVNCGAFYYDEEAGAAAGTPAPAMATATATVTSSATTTTSSACTLGGTGGETIASAVGGVGEGCKNALASVCYTVSTYELCRVSMPVLMLAFGCPPCFLCCSRQSLGGIRPLP